MNSHEQEVPSFVCKPKENNMTAVVFSGKRSDCVHIYMAQVLKIDGSDAYLRYLKRSGNIYQWPVDVDESWQPVDDICVWYHIPISLTIESNYNSVKMP